MNPLALGALSTSFGVGWLLIALVVLVFFVRLYTRTRLSGFLWLMTAIVIWPFLARLSAFAVPFLISTTGTTSTSYAELSVIVFGLEGIVGGVLLLIAVIVLDRQFAAVAMTTAMPASGLPPYRV